MGQHRNIFTGDVVTVPDVLDAYYESDEAPQYQPAGSVTPDGELKGADLDDALTEAELSKSGTVAEKRERLAQHVARNSGHTD